MPIDVMKKINWKEFMRHPIVEAFLENKDENLFADNLKLFSQSDEMFQKIIGRNSLSDEDISDITNYIKSVLTRRRFIKSSAAFVLAGAGLKGDNAAMEQQSPKRGYVNKLKIKGINYDIGTRYTPSFITRAELNPPMIKQEMLIIKNQLNCNALRIYGERFDYLQFSSEAALDYGFKVWFSPRFIDSTTPTAKELIIRAAIIAQKIWEMDKDTVFVIGNEFTLDMQGFVGGDTHQQRGENLAFAIAKSFLIDYNTQLNIFLSKVVSEVRKIFGGKITYAAGFWEKVDWSLFDIVSVNKYRMFFHKLFYESQIENLKQFGKPVAITEFGCSSYKGADKWGGASFNIVEWQQNKRSEIKGKHIRDENVQADYIIDLLKIFVKYGIDGAFVFTFVEPQYVYDLNPKYDLDMASLGIMKVKSDGSMEPKKSFYSIADFYKNN